MICFHHNLPPLSSTVWGPPGNHRDPGVQDGSAGRSTALRWGETLRNKHPLPLQWNYVMICLFESMMNKLSYEYSFLCTEC